MRIFATDMDGTFLTEAKTFDDKFYDLFELMKKNGDRFVVASGGQYQRLCMRFNHSIRNDIIYVSENGALIRDGEIIIHKDVIPAESWKKMIDLLAPYDCMIVVCGVEHGYVLRKFAHFDDVIRKFYNNIQYVESYDDIADEILKLSFYEPDGKGPEVQDEVAHKVPDDIYCVTSGFTWFDILAKTANKGEALKKVSVYLNVDRKNVYAFGDQMNDFEMLRYAKNSYAVANSVAAIKAICKFEIPSNDENGVVKELEKILTAGQKEATIISGKEISLKIKDQIKAEVAQLVAQNKRVPKLAVILVGDNQASKVYVRNKERGCEYVNMESLMILKDANITQQDLLDEIALLNQDTTVDGILVQLPLPKHIDESKVLRAIEPTKDVDGFHPDNIARLFLGEDGLVPCTPKGMMVMLEQIDYDLTGKQVVVVGRSNIVGKPVALLALQNNATVTIAHSKTKDLKAVCKQADVLIGAIGKAKFLDDQYVKPGAVVLDVGINRDENNKLCGDFDFDKVKHIASAITPVPGGVGPMTITMLLENTLKAYRIHEG